MSANKPLLKGEVDATKGSRRRGSSSQSTELLSFTFYNAQAAMAFTLPPKSGKVNKTPFFRAGKGFILSLSSTYQKSSSFYLSLKNNYFPLGGRPVAGSQIENSRFIFTVFISLTPFKTTVSHIHLFSSA